MAISRLHRCLKGLKTFLHLSDDPFDHPKSPDKNKKTSLDPEPPVEVPKWKPGCPEPYIEDMKYNVIDKFFRNGKFGYVFELTTPVKFSKAGFQTVNPRILPNPHIG